jgi:hypothetical protein
VKKRLLLLMTLIVLSYFSKSQTYTIYGMTYGGGSINEGVFFSGENPYYSTPILASNGMIYGNSYNGGTYSWGVMYFSEYKAYTVNIAVIL